MKKMKNTSDKEQNTPFKKKVESSLKDRNNEKGRKHHCHKWNEKIFERFTCNISN
jgi:ribosomal protein L22